MQELPWITIFCHKCGDSAMIFTSDKVTNENHCRIASRVTKKIVIHGNECIVLLLTCYFLSWTHKSAKNYHRALISPLLPGQPFLTEHCDITTNDLWRHANAKYWYCDVIFVYCHCTCKLAQRRSSLVNNSREYRYLATRYSRLSV